ncbi:MAG: hypothetical protein ACFCBV_01930 [Phycisphaerales bacterium]
MVFLVRELREVTISAMRFQAQTGRDTDRWTTIEDPAEKLLAYLEKYDTVLERARHMVDWRWHASVMLDFRELRRPTVIERLAGWLGAPIEDAGAIVQRAQSRETLTKVPAATTGY